MTETPNRNLPLVNVDHGQRAGGRLINTALGMIDADLAAILLLLASKANSDDIGPAITTAVNAAIEELKAGAPAALDTLGEIVDKISNGDSEVAALIGTVATKVSQQDHDALAAALAALATVVGTKANAGNVYSRSYLDPRLSGTATVVNQPGQVATVGGRYKIDTAGGAIAFDLPAAPGEGDHVTVWREGANAATLARNGKTIEGLAENLIIDTDKAGVRLTYVFGTWRAGREIWT